MFRQHCVNMLSQCWRPKLAIDIEREHSDNDGSQCWAHHHWLPTLRQHPGNIVLMFSRCWCPNMGTDIETTFRQRYVTSCGNLTPNAGDRHWVNIQTMFCGCSPNVGHTNIGYQHWDNVQAALCFRSRMTVTFNLNFLHICKITMHLYIGTITSPSIYSLPLKLS